jgi:hypothetical protein
MAESLAHRWGQIVGAVFETFVRAILAEVAQRHSLYLDSKGPRKSRGAQRKVAWQDGSGNTHDLDYVLERGGTENALGVPVAFVESAWRRYTKHSKNKARQHSRQPHQDGEGREVFEVLIRFNTGARIEATFPGRAEAIGFLRSFT